MHSVQDNFDVVWNSYAQCLTLLNSFIFIFSLYFLSFYSFSSFSSSLGFCFPSIVISLPLLLNIDSGEGQRNQDLYSVVKNIVSHVSFICCVSCCSHNWSSFLDFKSWSPSVLTPSFHPLLCSHPMAVCSLKEAWPWCSLLALFSMVNSPFCKHSHRAISLIWQSALEIRLTLK